MLKKIHFVRSCLFEEMEAAWFILYVHLQLLTLQLSLQSHSHRNLSRGSASIQILRQDGNVQRNAWILPLLHTFEMFRRCQDPLRQQERSERL